ncbi:hypothetical protein PoB_000685400 [Plakobranchus ocellatus]|uniref:Uncharacterized protein n=1 Tax=Plakobranchus ocellatus TaxID=259542 RepID=A0AAV3YE45_9GAST|nr:hypothetical protein PoB_000685400 [Plakobranchus ocellatus]
MASRLTNTSPKLALWMYYTDRGCGMKVIPRKAERKVRGADLECRSGGGTEDSESALRFAETILSRDRAPS